MLQYLPYAAMKNYQHTLMDQGCHRALLGEHGHIALRREHGQKLLNLCFPQLTRMAHLAFAPKCQTASNIFQESIVISKVICLSLFCTTAAIKNCEVFLVC